MKQEGNKTIFGCMEFSTSNIKALYANCKRLYIKNITINSDEGDVTIGINKLKLIVDNIK